MLRKVALFLGFCNLLHFHRCSDVLKRSLWVDDGLFCVEWFVHGNDITFEVQAPTKDLLLFGLSKTGELKRSDAVTVRFDESEPVIQDMHGDDEGVLLLDKKQDWKLLGESYRNKTHMVFRFQRLLQTCDHEDLEIKEDPMYFVYSYSESVPTSLNNKAYQPEYKTSERIWLLEPPVPLVGEMDQDVDQWDIPITYLPGVHKGNLMLFKFVKGPELAEDHHIIQFESLVSGEHGKHVHHGVLFECNNVNRTEIKELWLSNESYILTDLPILNNPFNCLTMLALLPITNQQLFAFPENVGVLLPRSPSKFYLFTAHFDNMDSYNGERPLEAGMRIHHTSRLRKHEGKFLIVGPLSASTLVIPPSQPSFTTVGHTPQWCLEPGFPRDGMKITAVKLHGHKSAKHLKIRHFRGNVELPPIAEDPNFNFKYQRIAILKNEVQVLKGDQLSLECIFDTTHTNQSISGGMLARNEMCITFLVIYPKIPTSACLSFSTFHTLFQIAGPMYNKAYKNLEELAALKKRLNWKSVNITAVESILNHSPQNTIRVLENGDFHVMKESAFYPPQLQKYIEPDACGSAYH